jgi:hypothetical protein
MAEFTLSSGNICRPFRTPWGAFHSRTYPVSTGVSSAAIVLGRVVTLDASTNGHRVKASTANNAPLIVGIAGEALSGSTAVIDTPLVVWEANPLQEFVAHTKGAALSDTAVGSARTLQFDSTLNIQWVDLGASTAADNRVLVTQLIDSIGDTGGRVAFRFLPNLTAPSTLVSSLAYLAFYR